MLTSPSSIRDLEDKEEAVKGRTRESTQRYEHRVAKAMRKAYPFDEDFTEMMDFACGKGRIARGLAPYCKSVVGVDNNQAMVDFFAEKINNQGIPPEEMRVVCGDLKGENSELGGQKFDVVVCSAAYHHFELVNDTTRTLAFFLKPGGSLLVVDFMKTEQPVQEDVPHRWGFAEEDIRKAFNDAGLQKFSFDQFTKAKFHGQGVDLFLAKGTKPTV